MNLIGTVTLKKRIKSTEFLWGPKEVIAGKELGLIEQRTDGDCLCIFGTLGLVDVKNEDIESVNYNKFTNLRNLMKMHTKLIKKCKRKENNDRNTSNNNAVSHTNSIIDDV